MFNISTRALIFVWAGQSAGQLKIAMYEGLGGLKSVSKVFQGCFNLKCFKKVSSFLRVFQGRSVFES